MYLTTSSLVTFYNGQVGFVFGKRACRAGIDGPTSIFVEGPDIGLKTLKIRPTWASRGNQASTDMRKQMWAKIYEFSTLEFTYYDADVHEDQGKVIIETQANGTVELMPAGHPECIDPQRDLI